MQGRGWRAGWLVRYFPPGGLGSVANTGVTDSDFGSVAMIRLTGRFFGSVAGKGLSGKGAVGGKELVGRDLSSTIIVLVFGELTSFVRKILQREENKGVEPTVDPCNG